MATSHFDEVALWEVYKVLILVRNLVGTQILYQFHLLEPELLEFEEDHKLLS